MEDGKATFTKLDGCNYGSWKFKMKMVLVHKGFWDAVTGKKVSHDVDEKALATIGLSIDDSQIVHVAGAKTAKEAWNALAAIYENAGTANKMHLQQELMTCKMDAADGARKHIEHLRRLVGQLSTLGVPVSDEQYKLTLLRSLSPNFETLVVTLENMADELKIEDIHARIIREEMRQNGNNMKCINGELLQARDFKRGGFRCFYCDQPGHSARKCRKKRREENGYQLL